MKPLYKYVEMELPLLPYKESEEPTTELEVHVENYLADAKNCIELGRNYLSTSGDKER